MSNSVLLFRPVGPAELALIEKADWRAFPPRLPDQPFFYPVTNEAYATEIARDWNTRYGSTEGFVLRFRVSRSHLELYKRQVVGGKRHEEYWIPAGDLPAFNMNIIGQIEVVARFTEADRIAAEGLTTDARN